jgi:hypothetical protein
VPAGELSGASGVWLQHDHLLGSQEWHRAEDRARLGGMRGWHEVGVGSGCLVAREFEHRPQGSQHDGGGVLAARSAGARIPDQ